MKEQPNILFIQADQLTSFALGCYGNTAALTPNINRLAEQGVLFRNTYCNSPLCGPSRNSMMAGRLPHRVGAYDNANELPAAAPTFAHVLRAAGYHCRLSGKMHFVGPDQLHGFHQRYNTDIYPAGFNWTPDWTRGPYPNQGSSIRYLNESGPCAWNLQLDYDEETLAGGLQYLRNLVRARAQTQEAFFLCVSFTQPHDPFVAGQEYWDRYEGVSIPMPEAPRIPIEEMHPFDQWIQVHHEADTYPPSEETVLAARRGYLAMTSYIDDKVGELLAELDRLGVAENTVVVFASDHGDMQGEHGMWYKRTFHEWAMRVPLIVADPRASENHGREVEAPVSLVDLFPTFTELGGAPADWPGTEHLDGESLVPLMNGETDGAERVVYGEYCGEGAVQPMRIVRRGSMKYVAVNGEEPLLFNLENDPNELHNLAGDASVAEEEASLAALAMEGWDGAELRERIIADQKQRLFLDSALQNGKEPEWDYQPFENASRQYVRRGRSTQGTKRLHRWPRLSEEDA